LTSDRPLTATEPEQRATAGAAAAKGSGPARRPATPNARTSLTPIATSVPAAAANVLATDDVPRFEMSPHNCFACGTLNAHGLHLLLHVEQGRSWTELTLDRTFEGWEGIAHGGIVCTILDEVMAWALVGADNWGVTARMNVSFRRPVPVGRPIRAEGSVSRMRRRIVETTATLVDQASGEVLATATGTYVAADEGRKRELRERYGFRLIEGASPDSVDTATTTTKTTTKTATARAGTAP
jgi:uncharacterized protein (TIGR00369 family)